MNDLLDTPAQVLRNFLLAESGSVFVLPSSNSPGRPLYVSELPDGDGVPNDAAALYDTTGDLQARLMASGTQTQAYGIQLKIRSLDYGVGFNLCAATAKVLSGVKRTIVTVGSTTYTIDTIRQTSSVISLGQDDRRRALCTINFVVMLINA